MLESKRKALIFLLIAVLLAAVAGFLVLKKVQTINTQLGTMVNVFVANDEIASRKLLQPSDVTTIQIPQKFLREEYITSETELMGHVSAVPLEAGDIITNNMLHKESEVTNQNNRIITVVESEKVFFDEVLFPLDRVDIIVSHNFQGKPVTEVFMRDVKVSQTLKNNDISAARLEIPFEKITDFIHLQNYADSIRLVKANVSKTSDEQLTEEQATQENEQVEQPTQGSDQKEQPAEEQQNNSQKEKQSDSE